ncbi:helix-turn-helix domain-containing protein [Nonomuraea sp. NPDC000554]|uniref:helix-turn-helix domain-containing protein n=1 Tax=Nonomuraea sp. NPDC000554 TaxID=3154259 RepID=UPI00331E9F4E
MRRSFKFLLRPTVKQQIMLAAMLDDHRALYNAALQERREAYGRAKVSIRYGDQSAQLREIRADDPAGQGRWSFTSQQQTSPEHHPPRLRTPPRHQRQRRDQSCEQLLGHWCLDSP